MTVTVEEARLALPELLDRAALGEEIVITRNHAPAARLVVSLFNGRHLPDNDPPEIPVPRRCRVMGALVDAEEGRLPFALRLANGKELFCKLLTDRSAELVKLMNQPILIEGMVHFNTLGEVRVVETDTFRLASESDSFFNKMPKPIRNGAFEVTAADRKKMADNLASIIGKWPGDETDEEIARALEEIS